MATIKETIDSLKEYERRQLMYGFENSFSQYICLPGGRFIGVNIGNVKHLEIEQSAGVWALGKIRGACNED